ncbi:U3 snoRNP protein [Recurvomyces mirabilis]|nr:U3 snoRNP protein [Recurvomyces mirabilis]
MKTKAAKPSKVVKPKATKRRSTITTKRHRFEGFSERIAKLKIDPIRRRRNAEELDELTEETAAYFGRSLTEWRDLNLSATFTAFAKEVAPSCDSLPMVLHNEAKIMETLTAYIEKADELAMEPLLKLMSDFAHDLDVRFEKHFATAVSTIAEVAAKHQDPAVVEWSFTCLAWLFKYLSRLLVPDLRPLYDLLSPYLGKQTQKPFIIRFAAESLSFLVRKAAATYDRDTEPLDRIITHMLSDESAIGDQRTADLLRQGIMTTLTEAIRGVQGGIHSGGLAIVRSLLKATRRTMGPARSTAQSIIIGTLTSLIHNTNSITFQPVLETILDEIALSPPDDDQEIQLAAELLFTAVSVRKGTRVAQWKPVVTALKALFEQADVLPSLEKPTASIILSILAVTIQSATMDAIMTMVSLVGAGRKGKWEQHFLDFCDLCSRLGRERFEQFVMPQLQKFIIEQWGSSSTEIYRLLPHVHGAAEQRQIQAPTDLQSDLVTRLAATLGGANASELDLATADSLMRATSCLGMNEKQISQLELVLARIVKSALEDRNTAGDLRIKFALGPCLGRLLEINAAQAIATAPWALLCSISSKLCSYPSFLTSLKIYIEAAKLQGVATSDMKLLSDSLVQALALPSHDVRELSLELLIKLYEIQDKLVAPALHTAYTIESTPIGLASSRAITMGIRRLASECEQASSDDLILQAIPIYCFGLLHIRLAQAWDEAIAVIIELCKSPRMEGVVIDLAQRWLEKSSEEDEALLLEKPLGVESEWTNTASDFECSNLMRISSICKQVFEDPNNGYPSVEQQFQVDVKQVPVYNSTSRTQALRVLQKSPQLAEKRSRLLVPVLLRWAGAVENDDAVEGTNSSRWTRKDQKAMLAIFAQFTNPKVLYRSADVYDALLKLCANGDAEIQSSALKAIFSWKDAAVTRYQEHLANLLDEARFREELSVFLQDGDQTIRKEDYPRLMPVLLRLLYGRAIAGGKHGQGPRRKAIFVSLTRFDQHTLGTFVDIATTSVAATPSEIVSADATANVSLRQQLGMLNMLEDLLQTLGADLEPHAEKVLHAVLICTIPAAQRIDVGDDTKDASLLRSVRSAGMQCLVQIFAEIKELDTSATATLILEKLIQPRLPKFATENNQSVSGFLRLLAAWSASSRTAQHLRGSDGTLLTHVAALLREPSSKDEVRLFLLQDLLDNLSEPGADSTILDPHVIDFVRSLAWVLGHGPSKHVLDAGVRSLTKLAERVSDEEEAGNIIGVCSELLKKPGKLVSPGSKVGLLQTLLPLLDVAKVDPEGPLYEAVVGLFSRLDAPKARDLLAAVLTKICEADTEYTITAQVCKELNAQQGLRLDEPNHDLREHAFTRIAELVGTITPRQWLPIIHNCLYYIKDVDDLVNRSSAAQGLARFIDAAATDLDRFKPALAQVMMPAIERGMRESTELVRAEYLGLLGRLVEKASGWQALADMQSLAVGGDEDASFFHSALNIQQQRRLRALRRLAETAPSLTSSNITKIFLPFLEHFVLDPAPGDAGRALSDQAVLTIGALAGSLSWPAFRATFKKYASLITSKENLEKTLLRLLGSLVDALTATYARSQAKDETLSKDAVIAQEFLPPLLGYLHHKDESTVDRRMPVAVTIVKLMLLLPESELTARLPAVLTDVCQVLRSKSQEARDQTRKSLASVLGLVGPRYLNFILKELRGALLRGYQLHVLSFTVHSLLVSATEKCLPGDLDDCLPELTSVIMDDIFGVTGQEKDAEEYKSGMKEVKSSKSFDTMELLSRVTPVNKLGALLRPIRSLLTEKLDAKTVKKVDELMTRLRKGVDQNPASDSRDMLVFCHEIVRQVYSERNAPVANGVVHDYKVRKYLIQMESANKSKSKGATTSQLYKLSSFALNLVRKVIRKHDDLLTPGNMAGFLPMAGDALVEGEEEVKLAGIRLLAAVIKLPLADLDKNAPVYVKEAVALVKGASNMTTESAKAALELITSVLRERRSVEIKERDIAHVLKVLKTDIDEPDRQGVIYKFLRAVLGRKIVITEVYELMDEMGKVMVTNPDRSIRESARSVYLQFIMDYPQGKDRWTKQAGFLVENLRYEHATGRQSVMELMHQLLSKLNDEVLAQLANNFFVALVLVQVGDTDPACRQMAGLLIAKLFERADEEQTGGFLKLMGGWLKNDKKTTIQVASMLCWRTYMESADVPTKRLNQLRDKMVEFFTSEDIVVGPQLLQTLLDTFVVMVEKASETAFENASVEIWQNVQQCLAAPSSEVAAPANGLLGSLFTHLAHSSAREGNGLAALPLVGSGGLHFDAPEMRQVCQISLQAIMTCTTQTDESLIAQTTRNLAFLGRCFAANNMAWEEEHGTTAIQHLLGQLSYIIRQENLPVPARKAAINCQSTLVNQLPTLPNLAKLLRPLYLLTDTASTQPPGTAYRALADQAQELMALVQKKAGSEAYIAALSEARKGVQTVREERRRKRKVEAVSAPEKWAASKRKKHEGQKAVKKASNAEMRGKRRGW